MKIKTDSGLVGVGELNETFLSAGWGRGWPGPTNTGYHNEPNYPGFLTPHDESPITSGRVFRYVDFEGAEVGSIGNAAHDCVFIGCRFKDVSVEGGLVKLYGNRHIFDFCSFEPGVDFDPEVPCPFEQSYQYGLCFGGAFFTHSSGLLVTNCDFWGFGNAIDGSGSTSELPHRFLHNWIHDAAEDGDATYHTDGIGHTSSFGSESHVQMIHNRIESLGNTNGIAFQAPGPYSNFVIKHNLLGGFGFTVAIWSDESAAGAAVNTIFTDNVFSTKLPLLFGPLYPQDFWTAAGSVWARNRWHVPSGAAWGTPSNDGKFWLPFTPSEGIESIEPVGDTDYEG